MRSVNNKSNEQLRNKFGTIEDILAEMRSIWHIEHQGRLKIIIPFVGTQVYICNAFGFGIHMSRALTYVSWKKSVKP